MNQKYKGRNCIDYLSEADLKRNNYIENFYRQHPSLAKDCAMAYQMLLYNKDLTEEDRAEFTQKLEYIRKSEEEKMKAMYREFMKRERDALEEPKEEKDMDIYIDKDKDVYGESDNNIHRHETDKPI